MNSSYSTIEKHVGRDVKSYDTEQESTVIQPTLKEVADPKMEMLALFTHSQTSMTLFLLCDTKGEIDCRYSQLLFSERMLTTEANINLVCFSHKTMASEDL